MAELSERQKELEKAFAKAQEALWDIAGVAELIQSDPQTQTSDFPESILAAIRIIQFRAARTSDVIDEVS